MAAVAKVRCGWTGDSLPFLPFESPESSLLKFAWANVLTTKQAASVFQTALNGRDPSQALNLPPNWARWIDAYRDTADVFSRRLVCACLSGDDWLLFETGFLRFCPICLASGYHSWWHQCHLHSICLVHGCRLQDRCTTCGSQVFLQNGGRLGMREPYICSECFNPIAGVEPTWDAIDDSPAIRHVLVARYLPWAAWLNQIVVSRNGLRRLRDGWYGEMGDPRLIRRRAGRERQAILSLCPPPLTTIATMMNIICVEKVKLWGRDLFWSSRAANYDPAQVVANLVMEVQKTFDVTDFEQFRFCQENVPNGFRHHCGQLRAKPLALWIVLLYTTFCAQFGGRTAHPDAAARWVENMMRGATEIYACVDAQGLLQLLKTIYCEIVDWLSPQSVRDCFDLEVEKLSVMPGVSAYLGTRENEYGTFILLIRPSTPLPDTAPFRLEQYGWQREPDGEAMLEQNRDCYSDDCWHPKGHCVRDSAGYRRIKEYEKQIFPGLAAKPKLPLGQ